MEQEYTIIEIELVVRFPIYKLANPTNGLLIKQQFLSTPPVP